jgi:sulfur-oxidizing protein SoxY
MTRSDPRLPRMTRRDVVIGALAVSALPLGPASAVAQDAAGDVAAAIKAFTGAAVVKPGRVTLELPPLAENGNSVPMSVSVDSPMTAADHVKAIHLFSEKNPISTLVNFHLGPRAGRAKVSGNVRLATTQTVTAIAAMSDGSFWSGTADVIVTLAACIDAG